MKMLSILSTITTLTIALLATQAEASPIASLYNTGVDDSATVLTNGELDSHYTVTSADGLQNNAMPYAITAAEGYPATVWLDTSSTLSTWISPTLSTNGGAEAYDYTTTFNLADVDLSTVSISGQFLVDDSVTDILLNGVSLGVTGTWNTWTDFGITSGFQAGENILEFETFNSSGPTGIDVQMTSQETSVPEPTSMALLAAGLLGFCAVRRKKNQV